MPAYGNAQIHEAVRFAAGTVVRAALTCLAFPDRKVCAVALHDAAADAGLIAVAQAVQATDKTLEVTAVQEEVLRILDGA